MEEIQLPIENNKNEEQIIPKKQTPLPVKQLFVLSKKKIIQKIKKKRIKTKKKHNLINSLLKKKGTIIFSESFAVTMIFPFLATMVLDFGIVESATEVGFYAGWIATSFNLAQLFR